MAEPNVPPEAGQRNMPPEAGQRNMPPKAGQRNIVPEAGQGNVPPEAGHDGRFGKRFDDEVSVPAILWVTVGLAFACGLGMLITWTMQSYYAARAHAVQPSPIAEAHERLMPDGPLLQTDPEAELEAMRHEMAERLGGYGWVDQGAGVVHIPIDQAISLLVERGSVAAAGAAAPMDLLVEHGTVAASGGSAAAQPAEETSE